MAVVGVCVLQGHVADVILQRHVSKPCSYHRLLAFTNRTTINITGTSINTPTTVASAAPDSKPNRLIAAATASSKKFEAPISAEGQATECCSPSLRFSQYASVELKST